MRAAFEDPYRGQLPDLQLHRWTKTILAWLINPILDPDATERVTMDHLSRLVTTNLRCTYERGATNIDAATLQTAAEMMILHTMIVDLIKGPFPAILFIPFMSAIIHPILTRATSIVTGSKIWLWHTFGDG